MAIFDFLSKDKKNDTRKLVELPVASIVPNPNQPRKSFDEDSIAELAKSIEQVGLIQPLMVRMNGQGYELIAGERRLRAVKSLGYETVSCIVCADMKEEDSAIAAVIENLQREDLDFFEEAECYRALIDGLDLTQEELAERLGKSQSFIANKLRVLKLSNEEREAVTVSGLSERHARAILRLDGHEDRMQVISKASDETLSVKATEEMVDRLLNSRFDSKQDGAKPRPMLKRIIRDYRLFMSSVNSACAALRNAGMQVEVEQTDRDDGMDVTIHVTKSDLAKLRAKK
ncbi:MAG: ParB/RepB/Spo0J family partition protein [Eubacteriales bacterium]|nr:ParB/RepB/Spo0J family partition protein [Eubacteriales bacterium]